MGLERGERVIGLTVLRADAYLVLGSRTGRVKRTRVADLSLLDRTWDAVMGLGDGDELLFGDVTGEGAHVLFYTAQGQLLRIDGDTVNPQATGTATGVAGIALKRGDRLLGGMVVPDACPEPVEGAAAGEERWQVVIISQTGYAHRVPLAEFPVQGRSSRGVRCLRQTKSGGHVGDVAVGQGGPIDVYLADGRRQRLDWPEVPLAARDVLGQRLVDAGGDVAVARAVILP